MDAEAAFFDDLDNLVDPDLAGVLDFKLATSPEATIFNGEYHRPKKWLIRWVERTIDEDASLVSAEPLCLEVGMACIHPLNVQPALCACERR